MREYSIDDSLNNLLKTKNWLHDLGFTDNEIPRVNSLIDYLDKSKCLQGQPLPTDEQDQYVSSRFDAASFTEIYKHYSRLNLKHNQPTLGKLKLACRAIYNSNIRSVDTRPRDHLFELEFASFFGSYHIDINQYDDIQITIDGVPVNIECKRISSHRKIGKNVNEASKQLTDSFINDFSRGCIALSLENIIDTNGNIGGTNNLLRPIVSSVTDFNSCSFVNYLSQRICSKYRHVWRRIIDIRILAVIHVFRFLVRTNDIDNVHFSCAVVPLVGGKTGRLSDQILIQKIANIKQT